MAVRHDEEVYYNIIENKVSIYFSCARHKGLSIDDVGVSLRDTVFQEIDTIGSWF